MIIRILNSTCQWKELNRKIHNSKRVVFDIRCEPEEERTNSPGGQAVAPVPADRHHDLEVHDLILRGPIAQKIQRHISDLLFFPTSSCLRCHPHPVVERRGRATGEIWGCGCQGVTHSGGRRGGGEEVGEAVAEEVQIEVDGMGWGRVAAGRFSGGRRSDVAMGREGSSGDAVSASGGRTEAPLCNWRR